MTAVLDALARVEAALADLRALLTAESAPPAPPAPPSRLLTPADLEDAAQALGVPLATIKAVKAVESGPLGDSRLTAGRSSYSSPTSSRG